MEKGNLWHYTLSLPLHEKSNIGYSLTSIYNFKIVLNGIDKVIFEK